MKLLKRLIDFLSLFMPKTTFLKDDLMDNEHIIMQQLFNGRNNRLPIAQTMQLFDKIEDQYYAKIKDHFFEQHEIKNNAEKEIELIEKYVDGKKKNTQANS